jgi:hypothetical protein
MKPIKILFPLVLIIILASCGGGSSSGGSSVPQSVLTGGSWNLMTFSSIPTEGTWPQKVIFNKDGTGSTSGGTFPNSTFTWTQTGGQVVMTFQGGVTITINNVPAYSERNPVVVISITLEDSSGRKATYFHGS